MSGACKGVGPYTAALPIGTRVKPKHKKDTESVFLRFCIQYSVLTLSLFLSQPAPVYSRPCVLVRKQKQPSECVQPYTSGDVLVVWSPLRDSGNVSFEDR